MKVLIADDEQIVRNGLRYTVDWGKYGIQITDTVSNGKKALESCEKRVPDVVITDIRMPVMDGLELTRRLLERYPDVKIIILSAYDDFKYAQEALRAGAVEYILKAELDCDNLLAILIKIEEEIKEKRSESFRKQTLDNYFGQLRENLFLSLLTTACYEPELIKKMRELEIYLQGDKLILLHMFPEKMESKICIQEFIRARVKAFLWLESSNRHWIMLGNFYEKDTGSLERFLEKLYTFGGGAVYSSQIFSGFTKVLEIQKKLQEALEVYNFYGKKQVFIYSGEEIHFKELNTSAFFTEFVKQMEGNHIEKAKVLIKELFRKLEKEYYKPEEICKTFSVITAFLEERAGISQSEKKEMNQVRWRGLEELTIQTENYFSEIFNRLKEQVYYKEGIISKAISYMQEHLEEEVTLQKTAEKAYCSPQYLSFLFKKITGENFSEYLAELRIKRAKTLLITTDYSITEIGGLVGIENASYFSKVFTKKTGISPNRYRKQYEP